MTDNENGRKKLELKQALSFELINAEYETFMKIYFEDKTEQTLN